MLVQNRDGFKSNSIGSRLALLSMLGLALTSCAKINGEISGFVNNPSLRGTQQNLKIELSQASINEGSSLLLVLSSTEPLAQDTQIAWSVQSDRGDEATAFSATHGSRTVSKGSTSTYFQIDSINDGIHTGNRTFTLELNSQTSTVTVSKNSFTLTLVDLQSEPTTTATVTVNQAMTQVDPASSLPLVFDVVFSRAIDPLTFTTADIDQGGTASGITWSVTDSGDHQTFVLRATAITGAGTVIPSIALGAVQDTFGNDVAASTSTDHTISFDNTPPSVTIASPASGSWINSAGAASVTFSGACSEEGLSVSLTGAITSSATCSSGSWSKTLDLTGVGDGTLALSASQTDGAGNTGTSAAYNVKKDVVAPTLSLSSPADNSTWGTMLTLAGSCEDTGSSVTISGGVATSVGGSATSFTLTCSGSSFSQNAGLAGADGAKTVTITQQDAAGNSQTLTLNLTKDGVTPSLSTLSTDGGPVAGGTALTLTGTNFQSGATVSVGGASCSVSATSATSITCTTGAGSAGWSDVTVQNPNHLTSTLASAFAYGAIVLGQSDATTKTPNISASFDYPISVFINPANSSLLVSDQSNYRVGVYAAIPTTNFSALSTVIGQPTTTTLYEGANIATQKTLSSARAVWANGTKLAVVDNWAHRILLWDTYPATTTTNAIRVIGQGNFTNTASARSASRLSNPSAIWSDGTKVVVADTDNNRVLIWNAWPSSNGTAASIVLGQSSFTAGTSGLSSLKMNAPQGVWSDGTSLWVADTGNNRILYYATIPTASNTAATAAIGQVNLTTGDYDCSATGMGSPTQMTSDGTRFYVADTGCHRIKIYSSAPTSNVSASLVLGQSSLAANTPALTSAGLHDPYGVAVSAGGKILVADSGNNRVLVWNSLPASNGVAADVVLGQPDFTTGSSNSPLVNATTLAIPAGITKMGTRLYISEVWNQRISVWNTLPTLMRQAADTVIGKTSLTTGNSAQVADASSGSNNYLAAPRSLYTDGSKFFVVDGTHNRVLIYNSAPTGPSSVPSVVVGQGDLTGSSANWHPTTPGTVSAYGLYEPRQVTTVAGKLVISDSYNNRVLIWNTIPTASGQPADVVIGQATMSTAAADDINLATGGLNYPTGVTSDGTKLYVADYWHNRVLVFNTVPTASGATPDLVVGQDSLGTYAYQNGSVPVNGQITYPSYIYHDGTRLFISDLDSDRILVYRSAITANGQAADFVWGGASSSGYKTVRSPGPVYCDGSVFVWGDVRGYRAFSVPMPQAWN